MNLLDKLERQRIRRLDPVFTIDGLEPLYEANELSTFSGITGNTDSDRARKYALQAMSAVSLRSTEISIEEGERVRKQLKENLNENIDFRFQGSVMTNTHIQSASDIDLLVITHKFQSMEPPLKPVQSYAHGNEDLRTLKQECYSVLRTYYPRANIDMNAKSIKMSGGSLRRDVDVVPSNWHDTQQYQNTRNEVYRGINILDTKKNVRNQNYPFFNRSNINLKDRCCQGRYKKLIRLAKTLKADSEKSMLDNFSSYDIQALFFHLDDKCYQRNDNLDLVVLGHDYIDSLLKEPDYYESLMVIDKTRKISDRVSLNLLDILRDEFLQLIENFKVK